MSNVEHTKVHIISYSKKIDSVLMQKDINTFIGINGYELVDLKITSIDWEKRVLVTIIYKTHKETLLG